MLRQRVLTALLLAPLVILLILLLPTSIFALLLAVAFLAATWEWTRLAGIRYRTNRGMLVAFAAIVFLALWLLRASMWLWPAMITAGVAWWLLVCVWLRHFAFGAAPTPENRNLKLLAGVFVVFPAWVAGVNIHGSDPQVLIWTFPAGHFWAFLAMLLVWAADTGAYFSGPILWRAQAGASDQPRQDLGRRLRGVRRRRAGGIVGGWLLGARDVRLMGLIVVAVVTVASSIVGDLLESLMKRHAKVKIRAPCSPATAACWIASTAYLRRCPVFALGKLLLGL